MTRRCSWCEGSDAYRAYHDTEWGVPLHDDRLLFECLTLEGAQAGLSWATILAKRDGYRHLFHHFDPLRVAAFDEADVVRLLQDPAIVRHRQKITSTIANARALLELQARHGSFDRFVWGFVDGEPQQNRWRSLAEVPGQTPTAVALSRALKKAGFGFVGPTTCYAFMQAAGMVNDHLLECFRHAEVAALA